MSYTLEQYETLCKAIAEGALRVKYQDKEVEYRSLTDMLKIKGLMEAELGLIDNDNNARRKVGVYGSGL